MLNRLILLVIAPLLLLLSGCDAIAGIFEAGMWTGVIGVIVVIAIIVFFISRR